MIEPLLQSLIDFIESDVRVYEQSRRIYLAPAERSARIRERRAWIARIRELSDEKGDPPCIVANS